MTTTPLWYLLLMGEEKPAPFHGRDVLQPGKFFGALALFTVLCMVMFPWWLVLPVALLVGALFAGVFISEARDSPHPR